MTLKLENQMADKFAQMQAEFKKMQLRMDEENQEKISCSVSEIKAMEHQVI